MTIEVHPLVWQFFKRGKRMTIYATNREIATGWAEVHGVEEYTYVGPTDLKRKVDKKPCCLVLYDFHHETLRRIRAAGYRTITPEGFEYK